jgi:hypothetical protein
MRYLRSCERLTGEVCSADVPADGDVSTAEIVWTWAILS